MPTKIDYYNDAKFKHNEVLKLMAAVQANPKVFEGVSVEVSRFPGGSQPVTLPTILSAFRALLPKALEDAEVILRAQLNEAAVGARDEALEIIATVKGQE